MQQLKLGSMSGDGSMGRNWAQRSMYMLSILVLVFILVGCSSTDPIQEDLLNYWNKQMLPLNSEESAIMDAYNNAIGDNYTNDEDLLVVLEQITPQYKKLAERIEAIRPETSEIKALHELFIVASNKQYNAFLQMATAIKQEDENLVVEANIKLDEASASLREYENNLKELQEEHDVEDVE
jgi:hypothetical protein